MAKNYLHKQTLTIAIVSILAVGGVAAYVYSQPNTTTAPSITVEDVSSTTHIIAADNNDWKKQFFDITGGNAITGTKIITQTASDTPLTLTDKVGHDFFARFIELKQNNLDGNPQLVQSMISQTLANAEVVGAQAKIYGKADITVLNNSSAANVRAYANTLATIFITYNTTTQSPAEIALNAFEKNNLSLLSQIDPITAAYKKMSQLIVETPVPLTLAETHLNLINSISSMVVISQSLRNIEGDPVQSIVSLGNYAKTQTETISALLSIQSYLNTNHIIFTSTEPGNFFYLIKP